MTLRTTVFDMLASDVQLMALGIGINSLYPNWVADSPTTPRFMILRWGTTAVGVGPARSIDLGIWAYDREPDYTAIDLVLTRCRSMMDSLVARPVGGDGYVLGVEWNGAGPDAKDDIYNAVVRNESYRITASGI